MTIAYVLLVAHFVADFLCQSDWMALNKSKCWAALTSHVLVYAGMVGLCMLPVVSIGDGRAFLGLWPFLALNAAAHFVQDAITSRMTSRLWFLPQVGQGMRSDWIQVQIKPGYRHWFFVAIGFDQLLHYLTLFVTAGWWLQ